MAYRYTSAKMHSFTVYTISIAFSDMFFVQAGDVPVYDTNCTYGRLFYLVLFNFIGSCCIFVYQLLL